MIKKFSPGLLLAVSVHIFAAPTPAEEIAARSGIPLNEIQAMLANCDSDNQTQMGMEFCAWRDRVVAEHELQQVVDQRVSQHPERKKTLKDETVHWEKARDVACQKAAHRKFGGGSIESTAATTCEAILTENLTMAMKKNSTVIPGKVVIPRHLPAVRSRGLAVRRREESAPFLPQQRNKP
jgi:uncharacterized protein YecT (DUF1311 family)